MEKPNGTPVFLLFILLGIILPIVIYFAGCSGNAKEKNYTENGRQVICTVTDIIRIGKTKDVTVAYQDENGGIIEAHATANQNVNIGDTFEAYVLPDDPYEVFRPADKILKIIFYLLIGIFAVIGWAMPFIYFQSLKKYDLLVKSGKDAYAELVAFDRFDKNNLFGHFRFTSDTGREHTVKLYIAANTAEPNEFYKIRYCELPNGKVEAEPADIKLNIR